MSNVEVKREAQNEPTEKIKMHRKNNSIDNRFTVVDRTEGKGFKCNLCRKVFKSRRNVTRHYLICILNPDKPKYECKFCSQTFSVRCRRNYHEKTHVKIEDPQVSQDKT